MESHLEVFVTHSLLVIIYISMYYRACMSVVWLFICSGLLHFSCTWLRLLLSPESIWVVVTVQDSSVLGLAEQLSSISTQDSRMDSEQCDSSCDHSPFVVNSTQTNSMLSINTQHSPILPRTPNPSPCSMQHGNGSHTELPHNNMVDSEPSKNTDSLQSDEGLGDDNT